MKITMLGTGHAMVSNCYNTCFIMEENEPILITSVSYDQDEGEWVFLHGNEVAASFKTSSFSMKLNGK